MSERQEMHGIRTDRPEMAVETLLTIADVLMLPPVVDGAPEVLAGADTLDRGVRWAHISDSVDVARLLDGGELLLTTGAGWPADDARQRAFVEELQRAGAAGILIELGGAHARVPSAVVDACVREGLPLVALHREVRFVAVTEAVHRTLIAAQTEALAERQRLHEMFTALSLRGAPADVVVAETARALGAPVALENAAGEVVALEPLTVPVDDALANRTTADCPRVPVEARGVRWGTLVAMGVPTHPVGTRTVLQQGATALAFGCLAAGGDAEWSLLMQQNLIDDLLGARFATPGAITARLEASGFVLSGRRCHGLVLRGGGVDDDLAERVRRLNGAVICARLGTDDVALLSLPASTPLSDRAAERIAGPGRSLFIGPEADDVLALLSSLRAARELAAATAIDGGPRVRRVDDRPLGRLVTALRDDRHLHEHSDRMLAPLLRYDAEHRGDLLAVVRALVSHPGNRSAAAAASHLSRSVFYQRLALIADLLEADLDDGETLTALHLAVLARPRHGDAR